VKESTFVCFFSFLAFFKKSFKTPHGGLFAACYNIYHIIQILSIVSIDKNNEKFA